MWVCGEQRASLSRLIKCATQFFESAYVGFRTAHTTPQVNLNHTPTPCSPTYHFLPNIPTCLLTAAGMFHRSWWVCYGNGIYLTTVSAVCWCGAHRRYISYLLHMALERANVRASFGRRDSMSWECPIDGSNYRPSPRAKLQYFRLQALISV